jgi:hypothetical protein
MVPCPFRCLCATHLTLIGLTYLSYVKLTVLNYVVIVIILLFVTLMPLFFVLSGVGLTSPGTAAASGLLYSPK